MATDIHVDGGKETKRHSSLWFSDGNIILAASSSNHLTILFRVHKSILSRHSQVFCDMFALPEDVTALAGNDESIEGVPLVQMHDSSENIDALLKFLYDPVHDIALTRHRHPDFAVKCLGIMRLANKYGMDNIKDHFIARLRSDWPKTLEEWDYMDAHEETVFDLREQCTVDTWPAELLSEPVSAAALALEYGVTDVLPSIFYDMHRRYATVDWDRMAETKSEFCPHNRGARWSMSTVQILHLRNIVREGGEQFVLDCVPNLFLIEDDQEIENHNRYERKCPNLNEDFDRGEIKRLLIPACREVLQSSRDWLGILRQPVLRSRCSLESSKFCLSCRDRLDQHALSLRKDLWQFLVEIFNPPESNAPVPV